jgi:hypothetical protein
MPQMIHFIQNSTQAQCLYRGKMKYVFDYITSEHSDNTFHLLILLHILLHIFFLELLTKR